MSVDAVSICCCDVQQWGTCCYCAPNLNGLSISVNWTGSLQLSGNPSCDCLKSLYPNWQFQACQTVNPIVAPVWSQSLSVSGASQIIAFQSTPVNNCQFSIGSTKYALAAKNIQINCDGSCSELGGAAGGLEIRMQAFAPRGVCGTLPIRNTWSVALTFGFGWQNAFGGTTTNFTAFKTLWFRLPSNAYTNCAPPPSLNYSPTGQFLLSTPPVLSETCGLFGNAAGSYLIDAGTIVFS